MLRLIVPIQLDSNGFQILAWVKFQCKSGPICHANTQPTMIGINQTLQTPANCLYQTVAAALCPTSDQEAISMLNHALGVTEIRDFPPEIDLLAVETKASTFTHLQPSASLQSP